MCMHAVDKIMQSMDFNDSDGSVQFAEFEAYLRAVLATKFAEYDSSSKGYLVLEDMIDVVKYDQPVPIQPCEKCTLFGARF